MWALEVAVDIRMAQPDDGRWRNKADAIADGRKDRRHVVIRRTMAVSSTGISVDKNERSEMRGEGADDGRTDGRRNRKIGSEGQAGLIYLFGGLARAQRKSAQSSFFKHHWIRRERVLGPGLSRYVKGWPLSLGYVVSCSLPTTS